MIYAVSLRAFSRREKVRASPSSSHPPPERWLARYSREMPVVGQGDRSNDDPQHGAEYEEKGEQRPPWRQRCKDHQAACGTPVHEHRYEQALSTIVDPHHKHPIGREPSENIRSHNGRQEHSGEIGACPPVVQRKVGHSPQHTHDEPRSKDTVTHTPKQCGCGEPCSAKLLEDASH